MRKYGISTLSTILFINSWDRNNENDKKIIERLSGEQYGAFEEEALCIKNRKRNTDSINWQYMAGDIKDLFMGSDSRQNTRA